MDTAFDQVVSHLCRFRDELLKIPQQIKEQALDIRIKAVSYTHRTDAALNEKILSSAAPHIIELLRRNSVTGAFFVLDGIGVAGENTEGNRAAFYVRDNDPVSYTHLALLL